MNLQLKTWQTIVLGIVYVGYLCWVMFGGMKKRKIKIRVYIIMTLLMIYGIISEFNGIHSIAEIINISIVLSVGFIKGIILGRHKIVEKSDHIWYMRHNLKYVGIWVLFFCIKTILSHILKICANTTFPMWHMILYFTFYYPWRTINVFLHNPQMAKEILKKK